MFTQQRFMNSTVYSFQQSIGFGETPSQVVINLVDDPARGDSFSPLNVGSPATFIFNSTVFTGIVQSYSHNVDTGGFTHEVVLVDPREFLDGTMLILDGYTSAVSMPNLLNIYGYLESFGFGNSEKNDTGIPWQLIRSSAKALMSLPQQGDFGGPLRFISSRYIVDLSGLPQVPSDYRVGADSISMLQFISEICEAGGCDYFINMIEVSVGIFVIGVNTRSRTSFIQYGAVQTFLNSFPEFESKSAGTELANEVMSRFVIGGKIREMWYQNGDFSLASIWPFWGLDINNNPIIGEGLGNDHQFVLDARSVNNPRVSPFYPCDVSEIRSVLGGRANWETFLILRSDDGSIHTNKAKELGIIGYTANKSSKDLLNELLTNYNQSSPDPKLKSVTLDFSKFFFPHTRDGQLDYSQLDIETGYLYDFLYQIATEYFGKKFLVNIPFTYSAIEPDSGKIRVSQFPVESGFLAEEAWPTAFANNLIPFDVDRFTEEDGKIVCFVRFDRGDFLDLSDLSPENVGFNTDQPGYGKDKLRNYSIFVKANVDENIVYLDNETQFGPRAVITLDGAVHERATQDDYRSKQIIIDFLNKGFTDAGVDTATPEYKKNVLDKLLGHIAQDIFNYNMGSTAVIPNLAVIPLESQTQNYGPWYANGIPGKVDFENDDTLVPWNYGGFDGMNVVALAKVNNSIGLNYQLEQGSITFPDIPQHNLGQQLGIGGPLVTDISVDIGSGGANTTYKFRRVVKQPRYGQAKAERVAQLARTMQKMRRNVRLSLLPKTRPDISQTSKPIEVFTKQDHPKAKKTSSHEVLVGQTYVDNTGAKNTSVFLQSEYNFTGHTQYNYPNKAFMSLDGVFQPYSALPYSGWFNHFTTPASSAQYPTVTDLSPFQSGKNPAMKLVARGQELSNSLFGASSSGDYRGIGLKGPLIISGPAFDTSGNSISDASDPGTWKTGPLYAPWDEDRGIYIGGGSSLILGMAAQNINYGNTGGNVTLLSNNTVVSAGNWLKGPICSGDRVIMTKENGVYYIVNGEFRAVSVLSDIVCGSSGLQTVHKTVYLPSSYYTIPSGQSSC